MLMPKKTKYRKMFKGRIKGKAQKGNTVVFPHKPITKRPAEVRMGKGKGPLEGYVAPIKEGTVLYEIGGVDEALAREAFRRAAHKLPVRCKVIAKAASEEVK